MSIAWLTIPSKRPAAEIAPLLAAWRAQGYGIALWRDDFQDCGVDMEVATSLPYPGYAVAVNTLVQHVFEYDAEAQFCIAAGDDIWPDTTKTADEISCECRIHFIQRGDVGLRPDFEPFDFTAEQCATFGVMQPTGDRDFGDAQGPYIDRVAGSGWIGREFARRVNKGNGPLWPAFKHMFVDQCLQEVAVNLGVFWQRPDLTQHHAHWGRPKPGEVMGHASNMPEFLREANSGKHWNDAKAEFERLKADGFAECMPL